MATTRGSSVTIDRAYFETLVRRANSNHNDEFVDHKFAGAFDSFQPVPRAEYDNLLLVARQYANLKQNLINGGVVEETIVLLSQDATSAPQVGAHTTPAPYKREDVDEGGARLNPTAQPHTDFRSTTHIPHDPYTNNRYGNGSYHPSHNDGFGTRQMDKQHDWADADPAAEDYAPSYSADGPTPDMHNERMYAPFGQIQNQIQSVQRPHYARMCKRTVALSGLPDNISHWDVTSVIRGGLLLDIFLRAAEHVALVSFLREEDAMRFYEHARKNDIYIKNKRVFIRWADRHFHLAGHVAGKIGIGATRNMIIRRCDPKHTEDSIRDDLEHIHNLIVVKVDFIGGSCYIKTNSVHNAMFARTCMMSRAKYKGSKIEWDVDECEQPIEVVQKIPPKPQPALSMKKPAVGMRNRFATLRLDDDDDETDDKFDTSSEMPSTVNVTA